MASSIEVHDVSKRFRLYQEKYTSLKERVLHGGRIPYHDFYALREIDLEIAQGETLGILGRNGCGKSTLLKCIAGVLKPSAGEIRLRGSLAAMLELGAGFQPELSGRDNVYLNASLLGMSRRDVEKSFDAIVAFAELEEFIDNQVRFYSSGMYVRLGFAVAVNVNPDILLVDEVLAVGDERFQQKCMERIHQFQQEGRTIVVVSHAADTMRQICQRVAVMDAGRVVGVAVPGEAIGLFRRMLVDTGELPAPDEAEADLAGAETTGQLAIDRRVRIVSARIEWPQGGREKLWPGEPLSVVVGLELKEALVGAAFGCAIFAGNGALVFDHEATETMTIPAGRSSARLSFPSVPLLDGSYNLNVRVQNPLGGTVHARLDPAVSFDVENRTTSTGLVAIEMNVSIGEPTLTSGPDSSLARQLAP